MSEDVPSEGWVDWPDEAAAGSGQPDNGASDSAPDGSGAGDVFTEDRRLGFAAAASGGTGLVRHLRRWWVPVLALVATVGVGLAVSIAIGGAFPLGEDPAGRLSALGVVVIVLLLAGAVALVAAIVGLFDGGRRVASIAAVVVLAIVGPGALSIGAASGVGHLVKELTEAGVQASGQALQALGDQGLSVPAWLATILRIFG